MKQHTSQRGGKKGCIRKVVRDTEEGDLRIRKNERDPGKSKEDPNYQAPLTLH